MPKRNKYKSLLLSTFYFLFSRFRARHGQLMIEAIAASSVLIFGFMGILALLTQSLHANKIITDNYIATYLAAEGIEIVKNMIDHNNILANGCADASTCSPIVPPCGTCAWNDNFLSGDFQADYESKALVPFNSGQTLLFDPNTQLYGYGGGVPTNFRRKIRITLTSPDEMQVISEVSWSTGFFTSSINLEDRFFNWR